MIHRNLHRALVRTTQSVCLVAFSVCLPPVVLAADGDEEFSNADASVIESTQSFTKRGPALFASNVPGETYSEMTGAIGHSTTDLSIKGNGLLNYSVVREYQEIPKQYPYALGTMSIKSPYIMMELAFEDEAATPAPAQLSCRDWQASGAQVYNTIKFSHESGMVNLIHKGAVHSDFTGNYPGNALYVSSSNWYLNCSDNAVGTSKFRIFSPSGATYVFNPNAGGERLHTSRIKDDNPIRHYTYKIYAESKTRYNTTLNYIYQNSPTTAADGSLIVYPLNPPLFRKFPALPAAKYASFRDRTIVNKKRLVRVEMIAAHESDTATPIDQSIAEKQYVFFDYRGLDETCPGKLAAVRSGTSKVKEVRYTYQTVGTDPNDLLCQLTEVSNVFAGTTNSTETIWRFAYRFRAGQAFLGGAGGQNDPAYRYLPLAAVETPTASKVFYDYNVMGTCEYQLIEAGSTECLSYWNTNGQTDSSRSGPRRPIVVSRQVRDKFDAGTAQISTFSYAENLANYTVDRIITDENVKHRLVFGRPDRVTEPVGITYESIDTYEPVEQRDRWLNGGRLSKYIMTSAAGGSTLLTVDHKYREESSFLRKLNLVWVSKDYDSNNHMFLYDHRRVNVHRTIINRDGNTYETRNNSHDEYNNLTSKTEINTVNRLINPVVNRRNTTYSYDNSHATKPIWFVGALSRSNVQAEDDASKPRLVTTFKYNFGGVVSEKVEAGFKTTYTYHRMGRVASERDAAGVGKNYRNYKRGKAQSTTNGNGDSSTAFVDNWGNITQTLDEELRTVDYSYDDRYRRRTHVKMHNGVSDQITVHADWLLLGGPNYRKKREIQGGFLRETFYDHQGRVVRVEEEDTSAPAGARIIDYTYDNTGRLLFRSDPHLAAEPAQGTSFTYDSFGRLLTQKHSGDTAPIKYCYEKSCNSNSEFLRPGNRKLIEGHAVRDQEGYVSVYNYRAYGSPGSREIVQISQQIDLAGTKSVITDINRNKIGFIKSVTQGPSVPTASNPSRTRTYTPYETAGSTSLLLKSEQHPEFSGSRTIESFDARANPTKVNDYDGSITDYIYDNAYRLKKIAYGNADTADITYNYFKNGLIENVSHDGTTWVYGYDSNNLLVSESLSLDSLAESFDIAYSHDNFMSIASITYPSGRVVNVNNNAFGETKGIPGYVSSINYHSTGQLASALFANGQAFESLKDNRSRPSRWTMNNVSLGTVFNYFYSYDDRGNIDSVSNYFGPARNLNGLTYDGLSRLKTARGSWNRGEPSTDALFAYNEMGDITNKEIGGTAYGFTYDPADGGKLSELLTTGIGGNKEFFYDDRGNVVNNGINRFYYNQMNQLKEVLVDDGSIVGQKSEYDGNAMRVKTAKTTYDPNSESITESNTTYHIYNRSGHLLHEYVLNSQEAKDHIYLNGRRIATRAKHNNYDSDSDGIPDYFERLHGLPVNDPSNATTSSDGDDVSDLDEYLNDLIPTNRDTNGDGIDDEVDSEPPLPPPASRFDVDITPIINLLLD